MRTIAQFFRAISSQLRHVSTIGKNAKQQDLSHMFSQYGELRPTNSRDRVGEFGTLQQISTGFASWLRYCTDVAQRRSIKLCTKFGRLLGWYIMYTFWGSCSLTKFCPVQNSPCVQVLRSHILEALLHCTRAVGVSQTFRRCTRNGILELSLLVIFNRGCHLYSEGSGVTSHSTQNGSFLADVLPSQSLGVLLKPRLHDTTCCQTGCPTGLTTG